MVAGVGEEPEGQAWRQDDPRRLGGGPPRKTRPKFVHAPDSSRRVQMHARKASRRRQALLCTLKKKITQADRSRKEWPHGVGVGTGGSREPSGADASGRHVAEGDSRGLEGLCPAGL